METDTENTAAPSVDVPRLVRLWEIDDADLTDEQLETIINERYAPSVIPKCRICGGDMTIGASGGGQPTRWYCSVAQDSKPMDWKHFGDSLWEDRRQGGDSRVMELLRRFKANVQAEAPSLSELDCISLFSDVGEKSSNMTCAV